MMLEKYFRKKYCPNCLNRAERKANIIAEEKICSGEKELLERYSQGLMYITQHGSSIISVKTHGNFNVVFSCFEEFDARGRLNDIWFYAHVVLKEDNPRIACSAKVSVFYNRELDYMERWKIDDISSMNDFHNIGIGSSVMQELISYARRINVSRITGRIANCDLVNKEALSRLTHFYSKFNFSISEKGYLLLRLR